MLTKVLSERQFEFKLSVLQHAYYEIERNVCHRLLRRFPPRVPGLSLLNLGCGPHIYDGWVNADDYAIKRRFRQRAFRPNWRLDITRPWQCFDNWWDGIFTEHVLEMLVYSDAINVLKECFRTLKSGAWIRISLPDLRKYLAVYEGCAPSADFPAFPHPALAITFLTQMHLHKSTWDADLMITVLTELGFEQASETSYRQGTDARLLQDDWEKAHGSMYIEARKP